MIQVQMKKYNTDEEYRSVLNDAYVRIEKEINQWDVTQYGFEIISDELWTDGVYDTIRNELTRVTENKDWADKTATKLVSGIQGMLVGIERTCKSKMTTNEIKKVMFNSIIYQLDDDTHSPCLLEDVIEICESMNE